MRLVGSVQAPEAAPVQLQWVPLAREQVGVFRRLVSLFPSEGSRQPRVLAPLRGPPLQVPLPRLEAKARHLEELKKVALVSAGKKYYWVFLRRGGCSSYCCLCWGTRTFFNKYYFMRGHSCRIVYCYLYPSSAATSIHSVRTIHSQRCSFGSLQ